MFKTFVSLLSEHASYIATTLPFITLLLLLLLLLKCFLHLTGSVYKSNQGHNLPYVHKKDGVTLL